MNYFSICTRKLVRAFFIYNNMEPIPCDLYEADLCGTQIVKKSIFMQNVTIL